jgi:hypothetical protein
MKQAFLRAAAVAGILWALGMEALAQANVRAPAPDTKPKSPNDPGYVLEQRPERFPPTTSQCIFFRTLYDWRPLNDSNLIVWAPTRRNPFLLQLDRPCLGLRHAQNIGFYSRDSELCGFGGDAVIIESGSGRPDRCPIGAITKLEDDALKALLAQAPGKRRQDKAAEPPPETIAEEEKKP